MKIIFLSVFIILLTGCGPNPLTIKKVDENSYFVEVVKPYGPGQLELARAEYKEQASITCNGKEYDENDYNEGKKKDSYLDPSMILAGIIATTSYTAGIYAHAHITCK